MNYSRSLNRRKTGTRVVISWIIIAMMSMMLGGAMGYAANGHRDIDKQGAIGWGREWASTGCGVDSQAVRYKIDTLLVMAKITGNAEKREKYLEGCEELLEERLDE